MIKAIVLAAAVLLSPALTFADDAAPAGIPAEVKDAGDKVADWLDGLKGKTQDEITTLLGKDGVSGTWKNKGEEEAMLTFKPNKHSTLRIYFLNGKAIKAALDEMSK